MSLTLWKYLGATDDGSEGIGTLLSTVNISLKLLFSSFSRQMLTSNFGNPLAKIVTGTFEGTGTKIVSCALCKQKLHICPVNWCNACLCSLTLQEIHKDVSESVWRVLHNKWAHDTPLVPHNHWLLPGSAKNRHFTITFRNWTRYR